MPIFIRCQNENYWFSRNHMQHIKVPVTKPAEQFHSPLLRGICITFAQIQHVYGPSLLLFWSSVLSTLNFYLFRFVKILFTVECDVLFAHFRQNILQYQYTGKIKKINKIFRIRVNTINDMINVSVTEISKTSCWIIYGQWQTHQIQIKTTAIIKLKYIH